MWIYPAVSMLVSFICGVLVTLLVTLHHPRGLHYRTDLTPPPVVHATQEFSTAPAVKVMRYAQTEHQPPERYSF